MSFWIARRATPRRRLYNWIGAVVFTAILVALTAVGAPIGVIFTFILVDLAIDTAIVARWARRDALEAYRQSQGGL